MQTYIAKFRTDIRSVVVLVSTCFASSGGGAAQAAWCWLEADWAPHLHNRVRTIIATIATSHYRHYSHYSHYIATIGTLPTTLQPLATTQHSQFLRHFPAWPLDTSLPLEFHKVITNNNQIKASNISFLASPSC